MRPPLVESLALGEIAVTKREGGRLG